MNDLYIMHYGVGHDKGGHSGRYPWGSGENPYGGKKKITKKDASQFTKRIMTTKQSAFKDPTAYVNYLSSSSTLTEVADHPEWIPGFDHDTKWTDKNIKKAMDYLWNDVQNFRTNIEPFYNNYKKEAEIQTKILDDFIKEYDIRDLYDLKSVNKDWQAAKNHIDEYLTAIAEDNIETFPDTAYEFLTNSFKEIVGGSK